MKKPYYDSFERWIIRIQPGALLAKYMLLSIEVMKLRRYISSILKKL